MGLFSKYKDKLGPTTNGPTIRTETVIRALKPSKVASSSQSSPRRESPLTPQKPQSVATKTPSLPSSRPQSPSIGGPKRPARKLQPSRLILESDSSEDSNGEERANKRRRVSDEAPPSSRTSASLPPSRQLWATADDEPVPEIIPANKVAAADNLKSYSKMFIVAEKIATIKLQYPGHDAAEDYDLVKPKNGNGDDFDPRDEIIQNMKCMAAHYFPSAEVKSRVLDEESTSVENLGVIRKMRRATATNAEAAYVEAVETFNDMVVGMRENGTFKNTISRMDHMPLSLVERILTQVYVRTISQDVEKLKAYENGTDFVYGELLPGFVSSILKEVAVRSEHVFVDLGSGVGNVVLQAALEAGCESWGCEIMTKASELAVAQEKEFKGRCRLWGVRHGSTHLRSANFLKDEDTNKALRTADIVLVNNQAFTPALNDGLVNLFLDLKEGCKIVSLKPFATPEHRITVRNYNSPLNLLRVQKREYGTKSVSWTGIGGDYYISTKDSSMLKKFAKARGMSTSDGATAAAMAT